MSEPLMIKVEENVIRRMRAALIRGLAHTLTIQREIGDVDPWNSKERAVAKMLGNDERAIRAALDELHELVPTTKEEELWAVYMPVTSKEHAYEVAARKLIAEVREEGE